MSARKKTHKTRDTGVDALFAKRGLMVSAKKSALDGLQGHIHAGGALYVAEVVLRLVATTPQDLGGPVDVLRDTIAILRTIEIVPKKVTQ